MGDARSTMDAAARAELADLRRRAYGPDADIADDPHALTRLEQLEAAIAGSGSSDAENSGEHESKTGGAGALHGLIAAQSTASDAETAEPHAGTDAGAADGRGARRRVGSVRGRRWPALAAAVVAAAVAGLGVFILDPVQSNSGPTPAGDAPAGVELQRIPVDGVVEARAALAADGPDFPLTDPSWEASVGAHYGFDIWLGASAEVDPTSQRGRVCFALVHPERSYTRCASRASWERDGLLLGIPATALAGNSRPQGLTAGDRLGFWWMPDGEILILLLH